MTRKKSIKSTLARREFLATLGAGAAMLANPFSSHAQADPSIISSPLKAGSSDRPCVAVIGLGNRGRGMATWQIPAYADVLAICDVDLRRARSVAEDIYKKTGRRVDVYQDYRLLLDRKDIHVIGNATPPHWHTKINVDACRAGKDVYAEKPLSLTVDEGKILRRVVEETGQIIQVGTQQRSGHQFQIVCSLVRAGRIGRLKQVAVILPGGDISPGESCKESPVPPELNWEMWLGQAPLHPYCEARFRRPMSWWEYGGGMVTDWGAHHMDIAHWGMGGEDIGPLSIEAEGYNPNLGKAGYPDEFLPFAARLEYPGEVEMWFLSSPPDPVKNAAYKDDIKRIFGNVPDNILNYPLSEGDSGVLFIGEKNKVFVGRAGAVGEGISEINNIGRFDRIPLAEDPWVRGYSYLYAHTNDFLTSVRTRQQPISDPIGQHRSQLPCHLVNIALRLGRKLRWDPKKEEFIGDNEANSHLKRSQRAPYNIEA
ncbi:MAG: Gfo/Idh/MocA family protein [Bacteroidota bacterium]